MDDAKSLLELFNDGVIYKTRYDIVYEGKKWEIDQFHKENEGLWIAEIELQFENESFEIPKWVLEEVTGNEKYYNLMSISYFFRQCHFRVPIEQQPLIGPRART